MPPRSERMLERFRAEAREMVAELAAGALRIERGECPPELPGALFRAAHTIKGGARLLGLDQPGDAAEAVETLLRPLRDGEVDPSPALGAALLAGTDALAAAIWPQEGHSPPPPGDTLTPSPEGKGEASTSDASVRVPTGRIDAVVGLVAEAHRIAGAIDGDRGRALAEVLAAAESAALRLRLVPLSGFFDDLRRAVRDAAQLDGKEAALETIGGDVEADAAIVDAAAEAVLQIARNAVAHGIESPDARRAASKPPVGRIRLEVRARGGWLEIDLSDDGRGLDADSLRRRAAERGLAADLPLEELPFQPGLSTRGRVDALGGQGVGLDVVRARVGAVGGTVGITWEPGAGSRFALRLPAAALYERLLVGEANGTLIGIPADTVASVEPSDEGADGVAFDGLPDEVSVLTLPLGPLFGPGRLARRAWIAADGRVGVVLDAEALLALAVD